MTLNARKIQTGFTLIEALIAFLLLSVGLLGALMFHSTLIKDSGSNKARLEALRIAERTIEERRNLIYPSAASLAATMTNVPSTAVDGTNDRFTVSWENFNEVVSDATYSQDVRVSWDGGSESIVLSTFFSWLNPKTINADDAGSGEGGEYDSSQIPLPTGTLTALERAKVVSFAEESIRTDLPGSRSTGNGEVVIYEDGNDFKVAVKLDNGDYVQLAKLSQEYNEILTISGEIRNLELTVEDDVKDNIDRRLPYKFDRVYEDETGYLYDLIDIRASAGANCIITDFENDADGYADYARYLCVAGTGWNGNIYPYYRTLNPNQVSDWDLTLIGNKDGLVCAPRQRNYRYYTLDLGDYDPEEFIANDVPDLGVSSSAQSIMTSVSAAVVGQSGLVRFYEDSTTRDLQSENEGVVWTDYFWPNPHYIVSPGWSSVDASEAYYVIASQASSGYKVPSFTSTSSANYSINYPGDVAYQNFIIGRVASDVADCDDAIYLARSDTISDPLDSRYFDDFGMPGYISSGAGVSADQYGYLPSGALASAPYKYAPEDFNAYDWTAIDKVTGKGVSMGTEYVEAFRGSIVLGYALATESLKGRIGISITDLDGGYSFSDLVVVGNPEPTAAINCAISTTAAESPIVGDFEIREFTCPVPSGWNGRILAHDSNVPNSGLTAVCGGTQLSLSIDYEQASSSGDASPASEIGRYIFNEILKLGDLSASDAEVSWDDVTTGYDAFKSQIGKIDVGTLPVDGEMYSATPSYSGNGVILFSSIGFCPPY